MARPLRYEASGAIYHIMARGDGGKDVFEDEVDRTVWLKRLDEVCGSYGWRVHAWVMMGNHFHLLLETPEANLVAGMKWFMGVFSQGWNRRRKRFDSLKELRRGWYLGDQSFGTKLLAKMKSEVVEKRRKGSLRGEAARAHDVAEAERLVKAGLSLLGLPGQVENLVGRGKWLEEKSVLASLLRKRTGVRNAWVADRLGMGHEGMSRWHCAGCGSRRR